MGFIRRFLKYAAALNRAEERAFQLSKNGSQEKRYYRAWTALI
jgi:hypothetical protein